MELTFWVRFSVLNQFGSLCEGFFAILQGDLYMFIVFEGFYKVS